jgi:hypothetical protein
MVVIDRAEDFQMGRVVSRTFGALAQNAVTFLILAAVLMVPVLISTFYFTRTLVSLGAARATGPEGVALAMASFSQTISTSLISYLVIIVFTYILQAALVQGTVVYLNGGKPSLADCLSVGFKSVLPLIALAILAYLGMILGFMLLLVPGIILALMWSVVVPVFVVEHPGIFASFGRSRALTKGHRGKIFLLVLLYIVIAFIIGMAVALPMGVSLTRPGAANYSATFLIVSWLTRVPLAALAAVGVAASYYELRLVKEGVGPQQLAAAFD